MRWLYAVFLMLPLNGCGYVPLGLGHRMKVCGVVVDENLDIISDTLTIESTADYPLINLKGHTYQKTWHQTLTDGTFCVDARFAISLNSFISGKRIQGRYISVVDTSVNIHNFKWVVERSEKMGPRPSLETNKYSLQASRSGVNIGYSTIANKLSFVKDSVFHILMHPGWIRHFNEMAGKHIADPDVNNQLDEWEKEHPGLIVKSNDKNFYDMWTILNAKPMLDYYLLEKFDSLYLVPGAIAKTRFIPVSLDTPVCNFGRLDGPPPVTDPRWQDSLLISVNDTPVIDAFYVYIPWCKKWGKAIIDPKIYRDSAQVRITLAHVIKDLSDTSTFHFWRVPDHSFTERQKCLTQVEAYRKTKEYRGLWYDARSITPGVD